MPRYLETRSIKDEPIIVNLDLVQFFESSWNEEHTKLWFPGDEAYVEIQTPFKKMVEILQLNNSA